MNFLSKLLGPVVDIRPGERTRTTLMFIYFFLTIALIYIMKPVRSSLFLSELGAEKLPFVYMAEGLWLIFVVWAYVQVAKRVTRKALYTGVLGFFISNLLIFWFLFDKQIPYMSAFFYVWVASFSITMTTVFWTLANDSFNPVEAKRLFGLILSGGSLGGVLGGMFTRQAVQWMRTEELLLVAAGVLLVSIVLIGLLFKRMPHLGESDPASETSAAPAAQDKEHDGKPLHMLMKGSSYLIMLAGLIVITKVASTVVDNQFGKIVELSIIGKDERTAFFGGFWSALNAISFVMQLFFTKVFLRYLGVGLSLWLLPVGLTALCAVGFFHPVLLVGAGLKTFDGSFNYSIQQASKEVLYLPLSSSLRYRVKPIIDMLGYRLAKTMGGFYILAMVPLLGVPYEKLGVLVLILAPLWMFLVWRMKAGYSERLREHLLRKKEYDQAKPERATDVLSFLHEEKDFHDIKKFMDHPSSYARKLAATAYLTYHQSHKSVESVRRVLDHIARDEALEGWGKEELLEELNERDVVFLEKVLSLSGEEANKSLKDVEDLKEALENDSEKIILKLGSVLRDPEEGLAAKRRAIHLLEFMPCQESVDLLLHMLPTTQDHALRFVIEKALTRLDEKCPQMKPNRFLIKSEILREAKIHQRVQKVSYFYDHRAKREGSRYLGIVLKAMEEESLERIFLYLDLLYPQEAMQQIYDQIREHKEGDPLRAHAIELFHNTLERDMAPLMQRLLERRDYTETPKEEVVKILQRFTRSGDRWLALMGLFYLPETQIDERWSELFSVQKKIGLDLLG